MQLAKVLALVAVASAATTCSAQPPNCQELWNQPSGTVCASNGRTYNNYCEVEYDRVKRNDSSLAVVHPGACNITTSTTSNTTKPTNSNGSSEQKPSVRSDTTENGPAALWAVAASALLAITFAVLI